MDPISEQRLLFETKLAVFGGRLCSLSIWVQDGLIENMKKIIVTSQSDISIFLTAFINIKEFEELEENFKAILTSQAQDPSILGIRIDTNTPFILYVDSIQNSKTLKILLKKGETEEINGHLLRVFAKEKALQLSLSAKCDELAKQLQIKQFECETLKMRCQYQEKEILLLRKINETSDQANSQLMKKRFRCEEDGLSCGSECDGERREYDDFDDSMAVTIQEKESPSQLLQNQSSTSNTPSTSASSIDIESVKKELNSSEESKRNEMLVGVVQYMICQLCPKEEQKSIDMSNLEEMEAHLLDKHVDKEKKQCEACPSDRYQPNNIAQHMRIHTNSIYACQHCGKRGRKNYLRSHIRTHTGERPYICDTCSKSFTDSSTLRRHRLVHTGEKKFQCPVCGRAIARKDNVKVHIRSHGIHL